jgi:hypothetical protein
VVYKKDVPQFGPPLPSPPLFDNTQTLRDFLIAKAINAENAAYAAPRFQVPHQRTREQMHDRIMEEYRHLGTSMTTQAVWEGAEQKLQSFFGRSTSLSLTNLSVNSSTSTLSRPTGKLSRTVPSPHGLEEVEETVEPINQINRAG